MSYNKGFIKNLFSFVLLLSATCIAAPSSTILIEVPRVTLAGPTPNSIQILYSADPSTEIGINTATFDTADISITGPGGAISIINSSVMSNDVMGYTVTYTFAPPGGAWSQADNGVYHIAMVPNQVFDNDGIAVTNQSISSFDVNIDTTKPIAALNTSFTDITTPGTSPNTIQITYTDADSSIDSTSFDNADISIVGPSGALSIIGSDVNNNTVTYTFSPPGGAWAQADNGEYTINVVQGAIRDQAGNTNNAKTLSSFNVNIDTTKPIAALNTSFTDITTPGTSPNTIQVTYTDADSSIDTTSFDTADISIVGQNVGSLTILGYTVEGDTVTYTFAPPGGAWAQSDNDEFFINVVQGEVFDISGNTLNAQMLSAFRVNIDQTKPTATLLTAAINIDEVSRTPNTIRVDYSDGVNSIDPTSIDAGDLSVAGCEITLISVEGQIATYSILPVDGEWGIEDSAVKTIILNAAEISDYSGNVNTQTVLQSFNVDIPTETWTGSQPHLIEQDIQIASGHELTITHFAQLEIADVDKSGAGLDDQLIELTVAGKVLFDETENRVDAKNTWRGFELLTGGYIDFGRSLINGDIYANNGATVNLNKATINGNLGLDSSAIFQVNLNSANEHTQASIDGLIVLNGLLVLNSNTFTINTELENSTLVIVENNGSHNIQGNFSGLPEGALISDDNYDFRISYTAGDGNDIALTLDCGVGYFADIEACAVCNKGYYCPDNINQIACPIGKFSSEVGQTQCQTASPGFFVTYTAADTQQACSAGFYQPSYGAQTCVPAPEGSFVDTVAATQFNACVEGTYQPHPAQTTCIQASAGHYVDLMGAIAETACPEGTTSDAGASNSESCYDLPVIIDDKPKQDKPFLKQIKRIKTLFNKYKSRFKLIKKKLRKTRRLARKRK
ncbi:hypothetical protein [Algibacillus agarilyticus]|uniref:hypothetical protein n=1 Tax=Algibacillus agarilyticus TaxID=2234133 RepID=UPI000DD036C4|nr:hypothetical protein [Algibacillus agarilyticus]